MFTLDDNQKFDYGIFIVLFPEHINRLSRTEVIVLAVTAAWLPEYIIK